MGFLILITICVCISAYIDEVKHPLFLLSLYLSLLQLKYISYYEKIISLWKNIGDFHI